MLVNSNILYYQISTNIETWSVCFYQPASNLRALLPDTYTVLQLNQTQFPKMCSLPASVPLLKLCRGSSHWPTPQLTATPDP